MNKATKLLLPAFLLAPFSAHAEEPVMEEVVVTATKRATTAQEVPFSLNVQTQEDIQRAGAFVSGLPYAGATGAEVTNIDLELDPYTLVNLNAGFISQNWEAAFLLNARQVGKSHVTGCNCAPLSALKFRWSSLNKRLHAFVEVL